MEKNPLQIEIEKFCQAHGLKPSYVGQSSVGNSRLYEQAKRGSVTFSVSQRCLDWMKAEAAKREGATA